MKATVKETHEIISGKSLQDIRATLNSLLKVEGMQALTAVTESGTIIHVELIECNDYIYPPSAALGSIRTAKKSAASAANGRKGGRPRKSI